MVNGLSSIVWQKEKDHYMKRREFLTNSLSVATATLLTRQASGQTQSGTGTRPLTKGRFKLKYAPHFGMFEAHAGKDLIDQLKFMADEGFRALEDNGMKNRPVDVQERIGKELQRLGMEMGVFVATGAPRGFKEVTIASDKPEEREALLRDIRESVEVAKRVGAKWCTVVPGRYDVGREWDYQTAMVVDNLRRAAEIFEPAGLVMVLEPLNNWTNHPGMFLSKIPQAYLICRAVNSPACKILFDMYHQQITEGNIIPNIDMAYSEVAYFQVGDNPGRKEPGTGEMNYRNIFRHIYRKGFTGVIGMEHGNARPGKEGERAVINAYVAADDFQT